MSKRTAMRDGCRYRMWLGLLLVAAACGGSGSMRRVDAASRAGPATAAARRALLAQFSPKGEAIVAQYEGLPTRYQLADRSFTLSSESTFDGYFRDSAIEHVVTYMTTGVHEMTHGYAGRMGFQVLAERKLPYGEGAFAFPSDSGPQLVRLTRTFAANQLDTTFPSDVRTFRYGAYINPATPNLATQVYGVYGLLDEYVAGYTGSRTTVELWPWVRDQAPADALLIINYAVALDDVLGEYAEFRLFILHYLLHAREHHPDIYRELLGNREFRAAFVTADDAFGALAATVAQLEPTVWALARTRGVRIEKRDGVLLIDGYPQRRDDALRRNAAFAHLAAEPYQSIDQALR